MNRFWGTVLAIVVGNILSAVVFAVIALVYLSSVTGHDDPAPDLSSACQDVLTASAGKVFDVVPANCAGDDLTAVTQVADELGVILP